nr:unnamed protein product [Spirometra erinaceieuropaei]
MQAEAIAKAFTGRWVAIFGAPSAVTTDRGVQLESALFCALVKFFGRTRSRTTAYQQAANFMVERFRRKLKTDLCAAEDPENWPESLLPAPLGFCAALMSDLDCGATESVIGTASRLPCEMTLRSHEEDEVSVDVVKAAVAEEPPDCADPYTAISHLLYSMLRQS